MEGKFNYMEIPEPDFYSWEIFERIRVIVSLKLHAI
jgi:hypothetical protein